MAKAFAILFLLILMHAGVRAQQDISGFLSSGISDIRLLIEDYAAPFIKGEGHAIANGWYTTGRAHRTLGIDLSLTVSSSLLPQSERFFDFIPSRYHFVSLAPNQEGTIPTAVGPDRLGPVLQSNIGEVSFYTPAGLGLPQWGGRTLAFMPIAQMGIGLIGRTELKVRYWPEIKIGRSTNDAIGFALMHEVGQWISVFERLNMNVSILTGFTRLRSQYDLSAGQHNFYSQQSNFRIRSYTTQVVLSKDFSALTFFVGGGYNFIRSALAYEGTFELVGPNGQVFEGTIEPISIRMNYGSPQVTFGAKIGISILKVHGTFTLTEYPVGTLGVSLGTR